MNKKRESKMEKLRRLFADYRAAEGCSCCRNTEKHQKAEREIAEILKPVRYCDGSGFDWSQYRTLKR